MSKVRNLLILLCLLVLVVPVFAQDATEATMMDMAYTVNMSPDGYMVGPNGMTLYTFDHDTLDTSNCYDKCATAWPPLLVDSADALTADATFTGDWGTTTRTDDTLQVTYNGQPLYYWFKDANPGDMTGQGVGNVWWIVPASTVYIQHSADLGSYLVGPKGMTVYMFKNDTMGATTSACTGGCATNWPAVTVADESDVVAGPNITGLGTIAAADGSYQVTYHGWPLYTFAKDAARGDTMGEGAGDKWYTIAPDTLTVSNTSELGDFLVMGIGGKTVYTFKNDTAGSPSTCTGDCATNWPAVTIGEKERLVGGDGVSGEIGTIATADGKGLQLTYNGWPLYTFKNDAKPGDTNGQAAGEKWYVVAP